MEQIDIIRLFDIAIGREVEAQRFYESVARRVADTHVRGIFEELARDEKAHEELLWKLKADPTAAVKFNAPPDYKVAESVELPTISFDMKPADAIALAMKKEQQAVEFYSNLAAWSTDPSIKTHYENLAAMEMGHKHRLESLFVDIGYPETW